MLALSPGLVQGCFELLGIVTRSTLTHFQIIASFPYLGTLSASKVIDTAKGLKWLHFDDSGIAMVSPWGARLLGIAGYERMLRQAILDYIDIESPPWVQNATSGRARVLTFVGSDVGQVFAEAELAQGTSEDVVAFWDALAARARGQKKCRLATIGREGERLTIAHEEKRTGRTPKWVAVDNNEDGYDILSIVSAGDSRQLSIEVKTSTMGIHGRFHVTRNEWERTLEVENHLFHLWMIHPNADPALAVVSTADMEPHIPLNSGSGSWETVEIPFAVFNAHFQASVS